MADKKKIEGKKEPEKQKIQAIAPPDKIVPKLCTHITFGVTQDKHVIIALTFQDESQNVLIERVVTTFEHAKKIKKVLEELIEKVGEDESNISTK